MFFKETIRSTVGYHFWANERIKNKAAELVLANPDAYTEDMGIGHGSLHTTLAHMLRAEYVWLGLIKAGTAPQIGFVLAEHQTLEALEKVWKKVEVEYLQYLDRIEDEAFEEIVNTADQNGIITPIPRWRMLQHVLYHSAQHRAEAALILTHLGHSPGDLDFIYY